MKNIFASTLSGGSQILAKSMVIIVTLLSVVGCVPVSEPAVTNLDQTSSEACHPSRDDYAAWLAEQPGMTVYKDVKLYQYTISEKIATFAIEVEGKPETIAIPSKFVYSLLYPFRDVLDYHGDVYYAGEPIEVPPEYRWLCKTESDLYGYCFVKVSSSVEHREPVLN